MKKTKAKRTQHDSGQKINLKKMLVKANSRFEASSYWAFSLAESGAPFIQSCMELASATDELKDLLNKRKIRPDGKMALMSALRELDHYSRAMANEDEPLTVWGIQEDMAHIDFLLAQFRKIIRKYKEPVS